MFGLNIPVYTSNSADKIIAFSSSENSMPLPDNVTSSMQMSESQAKDYLYTFFSNVASLNVINISRLRVSTTKANDQPTSQKNQTMIFAEIEGPKIGYTKLLHLGSLRLNSSPCAQLSVINGKVREYNGPSGLSNDIQLGLNDCLAIAKEAISKYESCFNASYCEGFDAIVPSVLQDQNCTIDNGSESLIIKTFTRGNQMLSSVNFCWYRKIDGLKINWFRVEATISDTGMLASFSDRMAYYRAATTNVTVTKEKAFEIAMPYIVEYARENGHIITALDAESWYSPDIGASRGDSSLLYPKWQIDASFDHGVFDPFNLFGRSGIFGYSVLLYADNGVVLSASPQGALGLEENNNSNFILLLGVAVGIVTILTAVFLTRFKYSKGKVLRPYREKV